MERMPKLERHPYTEYLALDRELVAFFEKKGFQVEKQDGTFPVFKAVGNFNGKEVVVEFLNEKQSGWGTGAAAEALSSSIEFTLTVDGEVVGGYADALPDDVYDMVDGVLKGIESSI